MNKIKRPNLFAAVLITVFILTVCAIASQPEPQKAFLDANAILQAWQSNYGSIKSMQVSYTEQVLEAKPPATDPNLLDNLVMWSHLERIEEGERYHVRFSTAKDGFAKPENLMEHAFDGSITREYWGMEKRGTIQSGQIGRSVEVKNDIKKYMLLDIYLFPKMGASGPYWEKAEPNALPRFSDILRRAISKSEATVRPNLETVAGKLCHVVEITHKGNIIYKIWVAHENEMLPLKYQDYGYLGLMEEIEVEQIAQTAASSIWYPVKAYRTQTLKSAGKVKYELTTHTFVPNVKVDDNTFRFDFPNGTRVVDKVLGIEYVVGVK